jgi:hypothetical protein
MCVRAYRPTDPMERISEVKRGPSSSTKNFRLKMNPPDPVEDLFFYSTPFGVFFMEKAAGLWPAALSVNLI